MPTANHTTGGDKNHGDSSYGTVMGTDCDCHCNKGYIPDNTLTCIKAANCQDECLKKMGEGANGSGTYPNCNCDCQKGYTKHHIYGKEWKLVCKKVECPKNSTFDYSKGECVCDKGFYPTPKDGVCIKQITKETCGNNHCDIEPKEGAVIEDCEFCPQDCKCKADEVCDVNNPAKTIENMGCIKAVAQLVEIGCADGRELPPITVVREDTQKEIEAHVGMQLVEGDEVRINGLTTKDCNRPYVTIQWGNVRGRLMLGQLKMYALTIKKDAIESGWPEITTREVGWTAWEVISTTLIESTPLHVVQLLLFTTATGTGEQDAVKVYVKSHIIINQTSSGINIYTLEGNPTVEYKGKNTTLDKSMKVTVNKDGVSTPANFTAGEVGDWFLRIPSPPGEENANANGGGNTMPDLSGITSQLKNTCCGSTAMIGMLLVLAAWGG
ncbi:hypothetical protein H0N99_01350, partial [Candidatus Micrarchaeota archaeon]|nr:hypothetical protein [Candidatus Micrarchaeota archaeon]